MPIRAKVFIFTTAALGLTELGMACLHWHSNDLLKFGCYLIVAVFASTMKVKLPCMDSTMSVNFLVFLLSIMELSLAEAMLIGCASAVVQSLWKRTNNQHVPAKLVFNAFSLSSNSIWLTYIAYHSSAEIFRNRTPLLLLLAACTYFLTNTFGVAIVMALVERGSMSRIWKETYFWTFAYSLAGAGVVGFIDFTTHFIGWEQALLAVPIVYAIFRSFQLHLGRLEDQRKRAEIEELQVVVEKRHVEQVCALNLRTIEGLALAIDAKDQTTHRHLRRVWMYAMEIAKELGLGEEESDALNAASMLHDIGRLAVPDHILSKPGRLTPEEFEKIKIHPSVGADILDRVSFPYPVAPIVRSHHEKWDGNGYPDGLKGEQIPIGARILAPVDCLDALTSDRPYRKAISMDDAMKVVSDESGRSFDPKVVDILQRRYQELEATLAKDLEGERDGLLNFNHKAVRGEKPAAGFEVGLNPHPSIQTDFLSSITSARLEANTLFELSQDLGNSLRLDDTLSLVAMRLRKLVPYDSIAVFINKGDVLVPEFVCGDNSWLLSSQLIPVGKGLCGWVAQNSMPILNGNPAAEVSFTQTPRETTYLRSALAVPLEGVNGSVGVLALYRIEENAFTGDHLRVMQVTTSKVGRFIENAQKFRQAETTATRDYLTDMPNARDLSAHLEKELARSRREHSTVAVMVCGLNGFEEINDRHGNLAVDKILKLFATMVRKVCREYDFAARMGEDKFVIIAPNMPRGPVNDRGALLSSLAQQAGREVCETDLLSLCMGAALFPLDGLETEALLAEADKRMCAAKQLHRECLKLISPTLAPQSTSQHVRSSEVSYVQDGNPVQPFTSDAESALWEATPSISSVSERTLTRDSFWNRRCRQLTRLHDNCFEPRHDSKHRTA